MKRKTHNPHSRCSLLPRPCSLVVLQEPVDGLLQRFVEGSELEVAADQAQEFGVGGGFPELAVRAGGIELANRKGEAPVMRQLEAKGYNPMAETGTYLVLTLDAERFGDGLCDLLDRHFFIFSDCRRCHEWYNEVSCPKGRFLSPDTKRRRARRRRTRQDQRLDVIVLPQHPNEQLGKVSRVDELSKGLAGPGDDEFGVFVPSFDLLYMAAEDTR